MFRSPVRDSARIVGWRTAARHLGWAGWLARPRSRLKGRRPMGAAPGSGDGAALVMPGAPPAVLH